MIPHPIGVTGLVLNAAGTVLLLWYPPGSNPYTADGQEVGGFWAELPQQIDQRELWKHLHKRYRLTERAALVLLLIGFLLQLFDLLIA
jgi:hypothetical protein